MKKSLIQMAYASSIGIAMVIAVFGCFFIGRWLDGRMGTEPYLSLLFLLIGIAAGFRNMYVLIKNYIRNEQPIDRQGNSEPDREGPPSKKA